MNTIRTKIGALKCGVDGEAGMAIQGSERIGRRRASNASIPSRSPAIRQAAGGDAPGAVEADF